MSYLKSLRFKLMLLCIIPLLSCAILFIGHSVVIAHQVRQAAASTYIEAAGQADTVETAVQAIQDAQVDMGWITKQWVIVFAILFVCFYIPITINIARFIKPIRKLADYSNSLAKGDINIAVEKNRNDELGVLQGSFEELVNVSRKQADIIHKIAENDISGAYTPLSDADVLGFSIVKMLEGNNVMMANLSESTQQISVVSNHIAESSQLLSSGSAQQAAAVQELSATIQEVAKIPHESMNLAKKAIALSDSIKTNAENGTVQMKNMVQAVKDIRDANTGIQKVIKVIDDIAFQTNILALNAAVEAARAGQHGKGFAVVAEEVRDLANKSADAAKETEALISDSMEKAVLGVNIAGETQKSIETIASGIVQSNEILGEIVNLSTGQDVSITGISNSVSQMSDVVQSNSAMAEEYAASSEEMKGQTDSISDMISRFKLGRDRP